MAEATLTAAPVASSQRHYAVDVMRGFALLGILVMNIPVFAFSHFAFMVPSLSGDFEGVNVAAWAWGHLFFDMKMMAIFSMLFGAGMVLLTDRVESRGASAAAIYYRRVAWLLVIGLLHAYLLWYGDILFTYAVCGFLIYPMRRLSPGWLIVLGVLIMSIAIVVSAGMGFMFEWVRANDAATWSEISKGFHPTPEEVQKEVNAVTGGYIDYLPFNALQSVFMQTGLLLMWSLWRCLGLMLLGMALLKLGVFSAARSARFHAAMTLVGFGLGLPIVAVGANRLLASGFDIVEMFKTNWHYNYIGSVLVALGWIGFLGLVIRAGAVRWLTDRLAAVGRMALTNYLMHTIICCVIFFGWGFGMWGRVSRVELLAIVLAIWTAQLTLSPMWLRVFRFGPAEWVWRSLTYWKLQPMRVE